MLPPIPTSALFAPCGFVFKASKFLFPSRVTGGQQHLHHLRRRLAFSAGERHSRRPRRLARTLSCEELRGSLPCRDTGEEQMGKGAERSLGAP